MSYIPTLLASLDARLDELAIEISTLEDGRAALRTPTPAAPPSTIAHTGAARKRPRRRTPPTKTPAPAPTPPVTDPRPQLAAAVMSGASPGLPNVVGEPLQKRPRRSGRSRR
jgi:hypothetical protein